MKLDNLIEEGIDRITKELSQKYPYDKETWISITNIKDSVKEPFDKEGVATKTFEKHYDNENSEYYHKTVEQIIEAWEAKGAKSRQNGANCDDYIGMIYRDASEEVKNSFKTRILKESVEMERKFQGIEACLKDFDNNGFVFECREKKLLLPYEYKGKVYIINGRLDALFSFQEMSKLLLVDWKNSEEIKTDNRYKNLLGPMRKFPDCDHYLFTLQIYIYRYILENVYGIETPIYSYIVQFPSTKDYFYKTYKPAFEYDEALIKKIIEYSIEKRMGA